MIGQGVGLVDEVYLDLLRSIEAGPCVIVLYRVGPSAFIGPFPNYDAAAEYRAAHLQGRGQINHLGDPTKDPEWEKHGQLAG